MSLRLVLGLALALALAAAAGEPPKFGANEGKVMDIDRQAGEITIWHGYLPELDMEPMSMVFNVADPELLKRVRKGDRVKFKAGLVNGRFAVISIDRWRARGKQ